MKKIVSILLVFAALAAMFSVGTFAADIDIKGTVNGVLDEVNGVVSEAVGEVSGSIGDTVGEISGTIGDGMNALSEAVNSISFDIMYTEGLNDFLAQIDAFLESVVNTIIDFAVQVMDTFSF